MRVKEQVRSPVRSPVGGSPGNTLPSWLKHLWTFKQGVNSKKGPDLSFLYPTGTLPDFAGGVRASTIPPIDPERGWFGGPGYTNIAGTIAITGAGTVANSISDPDGNTSVAYTDSANLQQQGVKLGTVSFVSGTVYTFRCIIKRSVARYVQISAPNTVFTGIYANFDIDGDGALGTVSGGVHYITKLTDGWFEISFVATAAGTASTDGGWLFYVASASAPRFPVYQGTTSLMFYVSRRFIVASGYQLPHIPISTTVVSSASGAMYYAGWTISIDVATALADIFTVCVRFTMGASSAETTADTGLITVTDAAVGLMYSANGGVLKAFDGANTATVTVTDGWARDSLLDVVIQTAADGATWKIGYRKSGETTTAFGSAATFDGSVNPGEIAKIFYEVNKPGYCKLFSVENKVLTDAEQTKVFNYAN